MYTFLVHFHILFYCLSVEELLIEVIDYEYRYEGGYQTLNWVQDDDNIVVRDNLMLPRTEYPS